MSDSKRQIGRQGEAAACDWLEKNGYTVIERNYTAPHGEIDIIAEDEKYIVFVEVKYRRNSVFLKKYGRPVRAVTKEKRKHVVFAAKHYLSRYQPDKKARIDVIEIIGDECPGGETVLSIKHYKNAFGE